MLLQFAVDDACQTRAEEEVPEALRTEIAAWVRCMVPCLFAARKQGEAVVREIVQWSLFSTKNAMENFRRVAPRRTLVAQAVGTYLPKYLRIPNALRLNE